MREAHFNNTQVAEYMCSEWRGGRVPHLSVCAQLHRRAMRKRREQHAPVLVRQGAIGRYLAYCAMRATEFYYTILGLAGDIATTANAVDNNASSLEIVANIHNYPFATMMPAILGLMRDGLVVAGGSAAGNGILPGDALLKLLYPESQTLEALKYRQHHCTAVCKDIKYILTYAHDCGLRLPHGTTLSSSIVLAASPPTQSEDPMRKYPSIVQTFIQARLNANGGFAAVDVVNTNTRAIE